MMDIFYQPGPKRPKEAAYCPKPVIIYSIFLFKFLRKFINLFLLHLYYCLKRLVGNKISMGCKQICRINLVLFIKICFIIYLTTLEINQHFIPILNKLSFGHTRNKPILYSREFIDAFILGGTVCLWALGSLIKYKNIWKLAVLIYNIRILFQMLKPIKIFKQNWWDINPNTTIFIQQFESDKIRVPGLIKIILAIWYNLINLGFIYPFVNIVIVQLSYLPFRRFVQFMHVFYT